MKKIHCTKCGKVCMSKGVLHGYVISRHWCTAYMPVRILQ